MALLTSERAQLETAPDAELDELTQLYVSRGLSHPLARQVAIELNRKSVLGWAGGSTRRSVAEPGGVGGVSGGGLLEQDLLAG